MDYKKIGAGLGVFAVVALAGSTLVSAANSNGQLKGMMSGRSSEENRIQMDEAIESGNYQTFKELTNNKGRIADIITEENFPKFVQMHNLMKEGKFEEAKVIRQELGLGNMIGRFHGKMKDGQGPNFVDSNGDGRCDNLDNNQ